MEAPRSGAPTFSLLCLSHSLFTLKEETFRHPPPACSPPSELASLPPAEVAARRRALGVRVSGYDVPAPVQKFAQASPAGLVWDGLGWAAAVEPGWPV